MSKAEVNGQKGVPFSSLVALEIEEKLEPILKRLNERSQYALYGYRQRAITDMMIYQGSFNFALEDWDHNDFEVGDIDCMIPKEHDATLRAVLHEEKIDFRKVGTTIISLIPLDGELRQVDFELKPFFEGIPTEFSLFSNRWDERDFKLKLKGAYHKLLLVSLTSAWNRLDTLSISYGLRYRDGEEYVTNMETIVQRLFDRNGSLKGEDRQQLIVRALTRSKMDYFEGVCELMRDTLNEYQIRSQVLPKFKSSILERLNPEQPQLDAINSIFSKHFKMTLDEVAQG